MTSSVFHFSRESDLLPENEEFCAKHKEYTGSDYKEFHHYAKTNWVCIFLRPLRIYM